MKRRSLRHRAGFSILEVGITCALTVLLVSLAVTLFSALLQAQRQTLLRERVRTEWMRLDTLLRRDAHAATSCEVMTASSCTLSDAKGRSWNYHPTEAGLVREVRQGDELKQQELFHLPKGTEIEFSTEQVQSRSLLKLKLQPPKKVGRASGRLSDYKGRILIGGMQPEPTKGVQP